MSKQYQSVIKPKNRIFDLKIRELFASRELIWLFVRRDFLAMYKQTLLGPLWFIINPLLTTFVFTLVFGNIAGLPTDELPQFLFYMASNIVWTYFSACVSKISNTFSSNARLFGKVYFPRLITPISVSLSAMINFLVQLAMFLCITAYYTYTGVASPNLHALFAPLLMFMCAMLAIGFGIIVSALTTKYRDLSVLVGFGVTLWMYISPVVYPASQIAEEYLWIYMLNPMSPIIEAFRYGFLGEGVFSWHYLSVAFAIILVVFVIGVTLFNKVEKNFMDTI